MTVTSENSLRYINERGTIINLIPMTADINAPFVLLECKEQLENDIFSERESAWHGEVLQAFFAQPRYVEIRGFINCPKSDKQNLTNYTRTLQRAFNLTLKGDLTAVYKGRRNHRFLSNCIQTSNISFSEENGLVYFVVNLKANMPFWQEKINLERISFTQKSLFFPASFPPVRYIPGLPHPEKLNGRMFFGLRKPNLDFTFNNIGDVETGFKLVFYANGHLENPSFSNAETGEELKIIQTMEKGDHISIINFPQEKEVIIREGEEDEDKKGFKYLNPGSKFFNLPTGITKINFQADSNTAYLDVFLYYTPYYLGAE